MKMRQKKMEILESEIKKLSSFFYFIFFYKKLIVKEKLLQQLKNEQIEIQDEIQQIQEELISPSAPLYWTKMCCVYNIFEDIFQIKSNYKQRNDEVSKLVGYAMERDKIK